MEFDITDPSDWPLEFAPLREIDSHLRCPICKEFLRAPMMLQCHHNFCSECIRRHLDKESNCPACRVGTSTSQLRRNVCLEEIANNFGDCRKQLLKTVKESLNKSVQGIERAESMEVDDFSPQQKRRRTSTRIVKAPLSTSQRRHRHTSEDSNDNDDDFSMISQESSLGKKYSARSTGPTLRSRPGRQEPASHSTSHPPSNSRQSTPSSQSNSQPLSQVQQPIPGQPSPSLPDRDIEASFKHSLVACPVCLVAIPESHTNAHLDKYCFSGKKDPVYTILLSMIVTQPSHIIAAYEKGGNSAMSTSVPASPQKSSLQSSFGVFSSSPVKFNGFPQHPQTKPGPSPSAPVAEPKRLPKLTYSVLTDKQLRKKLQELGIPSHGDKQLMQKRHAEYLTLYNANCDSTRPKPNSQLLKSLDSWEQTYLRDLNSKDFQRRAQEVQQQRYAQEMAHAQKQPAESITLSSDLANLPSSQSSNSGSSNGTNFVPNQANNNNINVAIAEQTAEAHKIKNADSYDNLIADIRKRMKAEKEAKAKAASEAATKAAVAEETIELTSQQSPSL